MQISSYLFVFIQHPPQLTCRNRRDCLAASAHAPPPMLTCHNPNNAFFYLDEMQGGNMHRNLILGGTSGALARSAAPDGFLTSGFEVV